MSRQRKKVCLITPNHISTNPRLVKEGIALENHGYHVHLIFTLSDDEGKAIDYDILRQHPNWTYDVLEWGNKGFSSSLARLSSGLKRKVAEKLFPFTRKNVLSYLIVNRHYYWQVRKAVQAKADLYIAHNLGALPVAKAAAKKRMVKYGFDAEDYHRHELSDNPSEKEVIIKAHIETINIPGNDHFTAASPLIGEAYQKHFPLYKPRVILNVFPRVALERMHNTDLKSDQKLFWFSQTIGENRGIETIIHAMGLSKSKGFELHLLGNLFEGYGAKLEKIANLYGIADKLHFHDPVPEKEIFDIAATCDIGMASEVGVPYNRNICLTNKIFTYIQSGLAVLASDTIAQVDFLKQYPNAGRIYKKEDANSLAMELDYYYENRGELNSCKKANFQLGQHELNWETEQKKFIDTIEKIWT